MLGLDHGGVRVANLERNAVERMVAEGFELLDLRLGFLDLSGPDPEVEVVLEAHDRPDGGVVQGVDDVGVQKSVPVRRVGQIAQEADEEERVPLACARPRPDAGAPRCRPGAGRTRAARRGRSARTGPRTGGASCPPATPRPSGRRAVNACFLTVSCQSGNLKRAVLGD